ncbi:MAG: NADH-quinone oxidoreductase subunit NuoN [Alphaproteobacteria bacterium]|nr:NADH-quinone oxidoreductase subunit NuoN [Alphaproteobacteria bacterium]
MVDLKSLVVALPEIELAVANLLFLVAAAVFGRKATRPLGAAAILVFVVAGISLFLPARIGPEGFGAAFGNQFVDDGFARFVKAVVLLASSFSILLSWDFFEKEGQARPEYPVLIVFAVLGMMLMISANDLLSLYVGLELQSLSLYVLAAFNRDDAKSGEAGVKYFVLGAMSSGILLYGLSLLYGFAGSVDFDALSKTLAGRGEPGIVVGVIFVCAALAFKIAAAPFHMWAPDVYEGAPTPVTAFFASAPKVAALALFIRFLFIPVSGVADQWHEILLFLSVASMIWGAFAGLSQTNLKRLLAYSAIANIGYLLVGVIGGREDGVQAVLIYFAIYSLTTLGVFAVILCLRRGGKVIESMSDLQGLSKTNPLLALAMAVLLFSLAGLPPLAGFLGKYFVFLAAVKSGYFELAVTGVIASVVAAFYYLRIVKVMYFDEPSTGFDPVPNWGVRAVVGVSSIALVALTVAPSLLVNGAVSAARHFTGLI